MPSCVVLAPVVRRLDNAIHWLNHYHSIRFNKTNHAAIRWIVIYPVDSVVHLLNNLGLEIEMVRNKHHEDSTEGRGW